MSKRRKKSGMKVAGVDIAQPTNSNEALTLDVYLERLEREVSREAVALLYGYLDQDKRINCGGKMMVVREKRARSKDSFDILFENGGGAIEANAKTIDDISLQESNVFVAQGYDTLRTISREIADAREKIRQTNFRIKPTLGELTSVMGLRGVGEWARNRWQRYRAKKPEGLDLVSAIKDSVEEGFGGRKRGYAVPYNMHARKNLIALGAGYALATLVMYLLSGEPNIPGPGIDDPVSRGGQAASGEEWNPGKGKGKKKPAKGKNNGKGSPLQDLQSKYLGSGASYPPERMKDIRDAYLRLTESKPLQQRHSRHDLSEPEEYFKPGEAKPYPLSTLGVQAEKPELKTDKLALLIQDVTGSMHNPERIEHGNPSPGYFLAYQLLRSYSEAGVSMAIMKFPLGAVSDTEITRTTSLNNALEALLYGHAAALDRDDVEKIATLYLTAFKDEAPMEVIFITDASPTSFGCLRFMELEKQIRGKDNVYWINTDPAQTTYHDSIKARVDAMNSGSGPKRYHYLTAESMEEARKTADAILKGFKR